MGKRRWPSVAVAIMGAMLLVACSVRTPRDGFTSASAGRTGNQTVAAGSAGGAVGGTGTTLPGDTTGGGVASVSGGASGGGVTGGGDGGSGAAGGAGGVGGGAAPDGGSGATASAVGVTKDTITISAIAGFSGNYGAILTTIYDRGFGTWVDDVNARGGINGRKIVVKKVDNKDTVEGGVAACKAIQNNGSYFAVSIVGFGGADVSAADCLDQAGITVLALNLSGWSNRWTHVFSAGDAGKQTKPMASFIANVIGDKGRVGIIHTDDPVNNTARAGLVAEMARLKMTLAHEETVRSGQASFVAEMQRMRSAKVTTVALIVNTNEVLGLVRDAKSIGYAPNFSGNYWVTDENSASGRALYEGIKAIRNYSATNSAAFNDYAAKARKYGHGDVTNSTTMALYGIALIAGQVLQNVGPSPSTAGLVPAIEALVNYNNGITMALSFGRGVRIAEVGMWPIQCCNADSTWKGIGDAKALF
jgi:ABC-type branched-subunit amino acid transport system substrate-binding protein